MIDIKVFTLALYPTLRPIHFLMESAERYGVTVHPHHVPDYRYAGWFDIKIVRMLDALKHLNSEYVLYTDGSDSLFTGPMERILYTYGYMGCLPMVCSASRNPLNDTYVGMPEGIEAATHYPDTATPYKFPHAGGFIGERCYIIGVYELMREQYPNYADDAQVWHEAWKAEWFAPVLDSQCEIFQVGCRGTALPDLLTPGNHLYNTVTDTFPCILHLNGGYTSPEYGKDDRLLPWFDRTQP